VADAAFDRSVGGIQQLPYRRQFDEEGERREKSEDLEPLEVLFAESLE